ncbi:MAG: cbb3-type cytochrome c oxidase N-terminal domain-containing protein [Candidatus Zixiibacteriota bacterium]
MADYKDELLEHDYDGIQEMDNNLPRWWLYLFYFTIIFSVLYLLYYHVFGIGYLSVDEYKKEINPAYVRVPEANAKLMGMLPEYRSPLYNPAGDATPYRALMAEGGPVAPVLLTAETDTTTYAAVTDAARLANGKKVFDTNCAQCHGKLGEGIVGPNLTDNYWLHGAGMTAVAKSVTYGYPAKGMIPWRGTLKPDDIIDVSSYVLTIHGTNPPNARAPQGELVEDF